MHRSRLCLRRKTLEASNFWNSDNVLFRQGYDNDSLIQVGTVSWECDRLKMAGNTRAS